MDTKSQYGVAFACMLLCWMEPHWYGEKEQSCTLMVSGNYDLTTSNWNFHTKGHKSLTRRVVEYLNCRMDDEYKGFILQTRLSNSSDYRKRCPCGLVYFWKSLSKKASQENVPCQWRVLVHNTDLIANCAMKDSQKKSIICFAGCWRNN